MWSCALYRLWCLQLLLIIWTFFKLKAMSTGIYVIFYRQLVRLKQRGKKKNHAIYHVIVLRVIQ